MQSNGNPPEAARSAGPRRTVSSRRAPDEHFARAGWYREKAGSYRQEAELHRKMFADYGKQEGTPALQSKSGRELPWVAKMRRHCESYMKEADRMAAEADRFAEFHRMRAEEMQGK